MEGGVTFLVKSSFCRYVKSLEVNGCRRDRDRMVVEFSVRGVQYYVIKFVSNLRQVGGFLRVLRFPPLIKLTATI